MRTTLHVRAAAAALAAVALLFCLVTPATAGDTATSSGYASAPGHAAVGTAQTPFEVFQFNLCNSGHADCYEDGASIQPAANLITFLPSYVVTLNEICEDDLDVLFDAFMTGWQRRSTVAFHGFWLFKPVEVRGGGSAVQCTNGERYGIAVMGYVPTSQWNGLQYRAEAFDSALQEPDDEWRVWACAYPTGNYIACVTHLTNDSDETAFNQCNDLTHTTIPEILWDAWGRRRTTIGGDFNLVYLPGYVWNVQDCVPSGWFRKGDGDVQHVMASDHYSPAGDPIVLDMGDTTDHPALLVQMTTG